MLPSRVVMYLLLAGCLFAEMGYRQVWQKLTAGLGTLPVARPGDSALWQARARLCAAPLRWLFDLGPASSGELDYARRLTRSLHAGMIVLGSG